MKFNRQNQQLLSMLENGVDNYDHADAIAMPGNDSLKVSKIPGNPAFRAQFDLTLSIKYFSVALGVFTEVTAAALLVAAPSLATKLAAFIFGNSDLAGGYKNSIGLMPVSVWQYGVPFVYGRDFPETEYGELDATAKAQLELGDLVIPYSASPGATDFIALVIVRCQQVAYGTLLDAINSDRFWLNNIRYVLSDLSAVGLTQFSNNIRVLNQSLFGLASQDSVSPNAFKQPEQFQNGIIDVSIKKGIDKNVTLATYLNYNSVTQDWSIFVAQIDKLKA